MSEIKTREEFKDQFETFACYTLDAYGLEDTAALPILEKCDAIQARLFAYVDSLLASNAELKCEIEQLKKNNFIKSGNESKGA